MKKEDFQKIDLSVPIKEIKLQPMERDSDCEETKPNQKDRSMLNNPEEDGLNNPFKFKRTKAENEAIEADEDEDDRGS